MIIFTFLLSLRPQQFYVCCTVRFSFCIHPFILDNFWITCMLTCLHCMYGYLIFLLEPSYPYSLSSWIFILYLILSFLSSLFLLCILPFLCYVLIPLCIIKIDLFPSLICYVLVSLILWIPQLVFISPSLSHSSLCHCQLTYTACFVIFFLSTLGFRCHRDTCFKS